ncbi:unnamed protein product [Chondrus crispus]|uniref:Aminoglycoside phosphotransferase domain-containing protein n=1 Tax=Chondrus crispus TaxID=2769 RepID=R7Q8S9_CHOCR|nr:unnamed protein product [Chondrus crispus]CDF34208.1 unnamed protein product [Chondrus crispus]|eukprot:XP_005714027.1 unnamed protein product [Chondrus crispus]
MAHAQGHPLDTVWDTLKVAKKEELSLQLHAFFGQLGQIHGKYIGSVDRGLCCHPKFMKIPEQKRGPFETEQQMNEAFAYSSKISDPVKSYKLSNLHSQHKVVFSHGNIRMNHVLVVDGRVQTILD